MKIGPFGIFGLRLLFDKVTKALLTLTTKQSKAKEAAVLVVVICKKRRRWTWDSQTVEILAGTIWWPMSQSQRKREALLCFVTDLICYFIHSIQFNLGGDWQEEPFNASLCLSVILCHFQYPSFLQAKSWSKRSSSLSLHFLFLFFFAKVQQCYCCYSTCLLSLYYFRPFSHFLYVLKCSEPS